MSKPVSLSKSTLIRSIQCQKSLYLYKNFYHLRDKPDTETQRRFNRGHQVGILAQGLFPGGKDMSPPNPYSYDQSVKATQALVQQQFPVIYEAAFRYHGITVALDILVCRDGKWHAYEVKSSIKISNTYLQDAAIQYHVITKSGLPLESFSIITINGQYTRQGEVDLYALFKINDVLNSIEERTPFIERAIHEAIQTITHPQMPDIPIGPHCYKPYTCDYMGYCWEHVPKGSIFESAAFNLMEKFTLYQQGVLMPDEVPDEPAMPSRQRKLLDAELQQQAYMEPEKIRDFLSRARYPVCFFDLEAAQHAIPPYDGTRPYQSIPFQYSVIKLEQEGAVPERFDFLAQHGRDGRREFVEQFLKDTEGAASIIVFNALLEVGQLRALISLFPEYDSVLQKRIAKMIDMEIPFKELWYYHPLQRGAFSLKALLPALAPDLRYNGMAVRDGFQAMAVYEQLDQMTPEEQIEWQQALKDYCHMDTFGLMRVMQALKTLIS
jgi:hypothetical protein